MGNEGASGEPRRGRLPRRIRCGAGSAVCDGGRRPATVQKRLVVDRNDTRAVPGDTRCAMSEDGEAPRGAMRVVLKPSSESGTVYKGGNQDE
jgi:hypothetical protein